MAGDALTWIIGKTEARLMSLIEGVEFITVDKRAGFAALSALRCELRARSFDVLLHMQLALRASLIARVRAGARSSSASIARAPRELQWLFTNARIAAARARARARQLLRLPGSARHHASACCAGKSRCRRTRARMPSD